MLVLVLVLVLVLAALLGGGGGNRGRAVCGGLVAGALRLGCGLAPLPGPRCFVLSANGKRPRRRSPGATLPALVWAAALIGRTGCGPWLCPWPWAVPCPYGVGLTWAGVGGAVCCAWHMCGGLGFNLSK